MKIWFLLSFIFLSPFYSTAQGNLGPRLTAMGNNGTAVTDIWTIQANPSGITGLEKAAISLNYIRNVFSTEISTQAFAAVIPFRNHFIGASLQRYGFSAYSENKLGLAYAKKFGSHLSLALKGNYHQLKIENYGTARGFSVDVGLLYQFNDAFTFGAFANNVGRQEFNSRGTVSEIPTLFNIGASYSASDKLLIACTLSKHIEHRFDFGLGIDYKIASVFSLRGGFSAQPFRQYAGFGLNYNDFLLDMATARDSNLGYSPQISIGYAF